MLLTKSNFYCNFVTCNSLLPNTVCQSEQDRANSSVFSDFRNRARDAEERTASGRLFQTELAAAEKVWDMVVGQSELHKDIY